MGYSAQVRQTANRRQRATHQHPSASRSASRQWAGQGQGWHLGCRIQDHRGRYRQPHRRGHRRRRQQRHGLRMSSSLRQTATRRPARSPSSAAAAAATARRRAAYAASRRPPEAGDQTGSGAECRPARRRVRLRLPVRPTARTPYSPAAAHRRYAPTSRRRSGARKGSRAKRRENRLRQCPLQYERFAAPRAARKAGLFAMATDRRARQGTATLKRDAASVDVAAAAAVCVDLDSRAGSHCERETPSSPGLSEGTPPHHRHRRAAAAAAATHPMPVHRQKVPRPDHRLG